jgi:hypothetical protein
MPTQATACINPNGPPHKCRQAKKDKRSWEKRFRGMIQETKQGHVFITNAVVNATSFYDRTRMAPNSWCFHKGKPRLAMGQPGFSQVFGRSY